MKRLTPFLSCLLVASLAIFPMGCSTRYLAHQDQPQPYQSEHLDTKVTLAKQGGLRVDETTISYCLSKSTPVVNHYHGADTYKRSSWLGIGILVGSAYLGWCGIDHWMNTPEKDAYGDPNPNYEKERTLGKSLTFSAIGGIIAGTVIHFVANRELTKSTVKIDTALAYEPIQGAPIKIYKENTLVQNQRTDEKGNFKVDLSPFLRYPSAIEDINLKICASEYPSAVEHLLLPASFITHVHQKRLWNASGFTEDAMDRWTSYGFLTPQAAQEWERAGLEPAQASVWKSRGLSPTQARERVDAEQKVEGARRAKQEAKQREIEELKAKAEKLPAIMLANPYDTKGKLYEVVGMQFQLLSKSVALYNTDNKFVFLADFGSSSAPRLFKGIARAGEPYSYPGTDGTVHIVPRLKVLHIIEQMPKS